MPAGDRFVEVPSPVLVAFLEKLKFSPTRVGNEVVYERASGQCEHMKLRVYTSIRVGEENARGLGKDAIKVAAFYKRGTYSKGIAKVARVYRTGTVDGVLLRIKDRILAVAEVANKWLENEKCFACSAKTR